MRRALAAVVALAAALAGASEAGAQTVVPVDCARPVRPAILHGMRAAVGVPVQHVAYAGQPGCDAPGDPLTATVGWGDGTTSQAIVTPEGTGWRIAATHTYARPGTYAIGIEVVNWRTGVRTAWWNANAEVIETGTRTMSEPLRRRAGVGFSGRVAWVRLSTPTAGLRTFRARIAWGDGRHGTGTVTFRGDVLEVRGDHTWRRPLRGRVTVTVTDVVTGGVLTTRRPLRVGRR